MTIWLFGDSIFHGEKGEQNLPENHPLWPIRSPAQMIGMLLPEQDVRLGGLTGIPERVEDCAAAIARRVASEIMSDDAIVMLDVGRHSLDPDVHERQWLRLRRAVSGHPGPLLICEGFDNGALGRPAFMHAQAIHGRSPNEAVRAAAQAQVDGGGGATFVPTHAPLQAFDSAARRGFGARVFRRDGVHLKPWGQARLSWLIVEAGGWSGEARREPFTDIAVAAWEALGTNGPQSARALAELALAPLKPA